MYEQAYKGALSFAADAWTSPNHKACVALTVCFEEEGEPIVLLLDIIELAKSHSGVNLATAVAQILDDFSIGDKVNYGNDWEIRN